MSEKYDNDKYLEKGSTKKTTKEQMIYGNDKPLSEKEKEKMKYQDNMLNE
jgi:hypothetical protein